MYDIVIIGAGVSGACIARELDIPFELNLAMAENAWTNGVTFSFCTGVTGIEKQGEGFLLQISTGVDIAAAKNIEAISPLRSPKS